MNAHRWQLVPHHWSLSPDSLERNRWQIAAYGAAFAAGGRVSHATAQRAAAEGRRLQAETGYPWWVHDATGSRPAFPANGSIV